VAQRRAAVARAAQPRIGAGLAKKALCSVPRPLTYIRWLGGATLSVRGVGGTRSCRLAFARGAGVIAASYPFRVNSLIAAGSTGRRPPLPQPVPLATDVVEHRLGAAEVRGDPRPIARTVFEDPAPAREVAERGTVIARWIAGPEIHL
jgi:hypothetical protein